jgi:hypothetical protein
MSLITSALMMEAETVFKILDCNSILITLKDFNEFTNTARTTKSTIRWAGHGEDEKCVQNSIWKA